MNEREMSKLPLLLHTNPDPHPSAIHLPHASTPVAAPLLPAACSGDRPSCWLPAAAEPPASASCRVC